MQDLLAAKRDLRLSREIKRLARYNGLIIDDLGYLQPASTPEEAFTILRDFLVANHLVPATTQELKTPGIAKTQS